MRNGLFSAHAHGVSETQIKAVFLEKFTHLIEWPGDTNNDFVICVLNDDKFASALEDIYERKQFKGKPVKVNQVAEELGVRYVLEGSVRKSGDRFRITAQLIDAETGAHVWAERWDRVLDDLFALQDELTSAIVTAVEPELGAHERKHRQGERKGKVVHQVRGLNADDGAVLVYF